MENVIRNAIRYAPRDSEMEVSLARQNGTVVCKVRDHGPGVPEEALPHLFDAFYRVESDRSRIPAASAWGSPSPAAPSSCTKAPSAPATRSPGWKWRWSCRRRQTERPGMGICRRHP